VKEIPIAELRHSVELENRADLCAASCNFGDAVALMREANRIRGGVFGGCDPNELRDKTLAALTRVQVESSDG
jgi:hypothetical protein